MQNESLVQKIGDQILHIRSLMEAQLPFLEGEVNRFITQQSRSTNDIEHILDTLLDYRRMDLGKDLFIRLLEYYKTVDAEAAADYWRFFEEIDAE